MTSVVAHTSPCKCSTISGIYLFSLNGLKVWTASDISKPTNSIFFLKSAITEKAYLWNQKQQRFKYPCHCWLAVWSWANHFMSLSLQPNMVVARIQWNHSTLRYLVLSRYSINIRHFIPNSPLFLLFLCWEASPMESLLAFPGLANDSLFVPMCFPRTYHQYFPCYIGNNLFMCVSPHMSLNVH